MKALFWSTENKNISKIACFNDEMRTFETLISLEIEDYT